VKVLIVDDHPIVVSGFKALLEQDCTIEVSEAATAALAEAAVALTMPDLCVLDVNLPGLSGFELARRLLKRDAALPILMFSMNDDPVFVAQAMAIGARGYVSKNDDPGHMIKAIHTVMSGGTAWPHGSQEKINYLGSRASQGAAESLLTGREQEIIRQLAKGRSMAEIAEIVGVSYKTVATTCAALRAKLNARTQVELVRIAVERKLV
jgi:two-component system, NarL family, invasion response regulator UvrY